MRSRRTTLRASVPALFLAVVVLSTVGCLGYRVGNLLPEGITSIYVPVFKNQTTEPNLEVKAANALINDLNRDGSLEVAPSEDKADSVLEATITGYTRKPVRYSDVTNPAEYRITITVRASLLNTATGEYIWKDKRISGEKDFEVQGSLPASERRAIPEALEDLAEEIRTEIVFGWN